MIALDMQQGSKEWFDIRRGCVTSSRVADAVAKLKRKEGEAAVRRNLRLELVGEILTGKASEHYVSQYMEEGREREPLARTEYEILTGNAVQQVGFVCHPTIKMAGCSPDGVVGEHGLIEIKCPKLTTHIDYLVGGSVPEEYMPQMFWQMACCEAQWNDFVSYHPDLPDPYRLLICRLKRNEEIIAAMNAEVEQFLAEVQEMVESLKVRA